MSIITQTNFAAALFDEEGGLPAGLKAWNCGEPFRRFGVYRNNVLSGLVRALAGRFPAGERIVGEVFFAAMASAFVAAHPPRSPLLLDYGDAFPDFAARFAPAAGLPYLADVMRLEVARSRAYHAADEAVLDPQTLAGLAPARLPFLRFRPHPAAGLLPSDHPVVTIWAMNADVIPLQPIAHWHGEAALVTRPEMNVLVRGLPAGGAVFLQCLLAGETLETAAVAAMDSDAGFDLTANLAGALTAGVFSTLQKEP